MVVYNQIKLLITKSEKLNVLLFHLNTYTSYFSAYWYLTYVAQKTVPEAITTIYRPRPGFFININNYSDL